MRRDDSNLKTQISQIGKYEKYENMHIIITSIFILMYSKSTLLHALRTMGDGVANNLNDASHLPHLAESFLILSCTSCEFTEGSSRRYCTFTWSIQRVPSIYEWNCTYCSTCIESAWNWGSERNLVIYIYFSRNNRILFHCTCTTG